MPDTHNLNKSYAAEELDRVPSIDLRPLWESNTSARKNTLRTLKAALLDPGFFYASHTGIESQITHNVLAQMHGFFALKDQDPIKQQVYNHTYGWCPLFQEPAYQAGAVSYVESFDCGAPALGQNVWPEIDNFKDTVERYWYAAKALNQKLFQALEEILELPEKTISAHSGPKAPCTLRLLNYPANTGPQDDTHVGISAHTDFECCTLMYQTAEGLELTDRTGRWVKTPPKSDEFIVILGDMLERWTNGYLKATGHRVKNTTWPRYSIVMFFAVDGEHVVQPLPKFVNESNPACYPPITQAQHIKNELERARDPTDR